MCAIFYSFLILWTFILSNLTEMGQFGNLISCAKEEICLNTDYSPELMFPSTSISSVAAFLHRKEHCSGWKIMLLEEKGHLKSPVDLDVCWSGPRFHGRPMPGAAAFSKPSGFSPIAVKHVNLKIYNWVLQIILYVVLMKMLIAWEQASRDPEGKVELKLVLFSQLNFQQSVSSIEFLSHVPPLEGFLFY